MFLSRLRRASRGPSRPSTRRERAELSETARETQLEDTRGSVSIVANAASLMVSRVAVAAMGWFGTLLIVHHLSVVNWGRFSFVFGLLGLMSVVTNMANPRIVFQQLANDDGRVAGTYVLLRLTLGLFAYVVALSFVIVGHYPPVVLRATAIAGMAVVLGNSSSGYDVIFQFRMELSKVAVAAVLGQMAQLGLTIALALLHSSLVIFTVPAVLCEVVILAWKLYSLPKHPALHYGFMWRQWLELIKLSVPLALGGALSVMYYSLDTVMLSKMQTFRAVAIYGISYKFAAMVLIIGDSIYVALFPILVKYWPEEAPRFRAVIVRTMRLLLVVGALITLEFTIFAAKAIGLLYGDHYTVGANAARLVIASECLGFFVSLAVVTLISMNRNVVYPLAALVGFVINLGINLWVIPRWSYMGAAWATLATEIVVLLSIWIPMTRTAGSHLVEMSVVARVLLCSAAAVAATLGIWRIAPWLVAAVVGAGVYVLATAVVRVGGRGGLRTLLILDDKEVVTSKVPKQDLG